MTVSTEKSYKDHVFTLEELDYWIDHPSQFFLPEHYEVVEGRIVETMPTQEPHSNAGANVMFLVGGFVRANKLGRVNSLELGFKLKDDPFTLRCPDVSFRNNNNITPGNKGFVSGAPDLAVEIVSPGNTQKEMRQKALEYLEYGSQLVWIVNPEREEVQVYRKGDDRAFTLKGDDEITGGEVIKGFSCKVSEFFE